MSAKITGQRFGRLVALEPTEKRTRANIVWKCKCDCGNIAFIVATSLLRGRTKSCGCLSSETMKINRPATLTKDITDKKFSRITALNATEKRCRREVVWKCKCDCGKIIYVSGTKLRNGNTRSCGCLGLVHLFFQKSIVKINPTDVPVEVIKCLKAYYELRKAIKQAS